MDHLLTTQFLVLRKTPYAESSLVLAGISPDAGQIHFLVRGARKLGKKQFPLADLFEILTVHYRQGRGTLHTWQEVETERSFRGVVTSPARFAAACGLAKFALANVQEGLRHPRYFAAVELALSRLGDPAAAENNVVSAAAVGPALVFLDEHGLLPDYPENERLQHQLEWILRTAETTGPVPLLSPVDWQKLEKWVAELLRYAL